MDVVSRTYSSVVDQRISLHNDYIARTMSIGTNWTRVRIGFRWSLNDGGTIVAAFSPFFWAGLCSGTTNPVGAQTPTNWFGFWWKNPSIQWSPGSNVYSQLGGSGMTPSKIVNGVQTNGTSFGSFYISGLTSVRSFMILEITKGSPNWQLNICVPVGQGPAGTDRVLQTLIDTMSVTPMQIVGQYDVSGNQALAFDESAGSLDTINVYFGNDSRKLEISEIVYFKMA